MSTIASPREPGAPILRRMNSQQGATPTSSARPSLDVSRSPGGVLSPPPGSPNLMSPSPSSPSPGNNLSLHPVPKRNRAALREYYNLRKTSSSGGGPPAVEVTDPSGLPHAHEHEHSEVAAGEMDGHGFDAEAFVRRALAEKGLEELLRLYTRVLGETRALDAEKKALVYDNYSKLITATETIRKMRTNMDPLKPMASTLDPAIAQIYSQATSIRDSLRNSIPPPDTSNREAEEATQRRLRTKKLALQVLETPDKIRALVSEGRLEDARQAWKIPRKLLLVWKEQGVGGTDVDACIEDGDAAVRGEPSKGDWRTIHEDDDEE